MRSLCERGPRRGFETFSGTGVSTRALDCQVTTLSLGIYLQCFPRPFDQQNAAMATQDQQNVAMATQQKDNVFIEDCPSLARANAVPVTPAIARDLLPAP